MNTNRKYKNFEIIMAINYAEGKEKTEIFVSSLKNLNTNKHVEVVDDNIEFQYAHRTMKHADEWIQHIIDNEQYLFKYHNW